MSASRIVQWEDVNSWLPPSSKTKNSQSFLRFAWFMMVRQLNGLLIAMNHANQESLQIFDFRTSRKPRINVLPLYIQIVKLKANSYSLYISLYMRLFSNNADD